MITGKEGLLEALIEAFLMEKGTREFYSMSEKKTSDVEAKKMFAELTAWEERHMDYIQFLYQSLQEDRDLQGFEEFIKKTPSPVTEAGIPMKDLEARIQRYEYVNERSAVETAMEIEVKAYNLYKKISEDATDRNAKVIFNEMMNQEQKHIDYIKQMRERFA